MGMAPRDGSGTGSDAKQPFAEKDWLHADRAALPVAPIDWALDEARYLIENPRVDQRNEGKVEPHTPPGDEPMGGKVGGA